MVGIKLILASSLLFFQGILAFCVHNELDDGTAFKVSQADSGAIPWAAFSKLLDMTDEACCSHMTKDCSLYRVDNDIALFFIRFFFPDRTITDVYARCTTGGTLVFYGTQDNYYAKCTDVKGRVLDVEIQTDKDAPFDLFSVLVDGPPVYPANAPGYDNLFG
ncbi:hypothetical protein EDC94DRAFT_607098 [Helicostylum pulchrum]|nr:hypothetical protein EDC94DRAFT_607098 [Helicostylum pulchrum]